MHSIELHTQHVLELLLGIWLLGATISGIMAHRLFFGASYTYQNNQDDTMRRVAAVSFAGCSWLGVVAMALIFIFEENKN